MEVWSIVVAAGSGARFGAAKQFELIPAPGTRAGAERVVDRSVRLAREHSDGVVLVLPAGFAWDGPPVDAVVDGGATRSASVRQGLAEVPASADVVLVHDAARPLADPALWSRVLDALAAGADAVVPGVPVADTLKRVADGEVVATVPRADLVAVQTPQGFRAEVLRRAHAGGADDTDDAALVEAIGGTVRVVAGAAGNLKVTTPDDLDRVARTIEAGAPGGAVEQPAGGRR